VTCASVPLCATSCSLTDAPHPLFQRQGGEAGSGSAEGLSQRARGGAADGTAGELSALSDVPAEEVAASPSLGGAQALPSDLQVRFRAHRAWQQLWAREATGVCRPC